MNQNKFFYTKKTKNEKKINLIFEDEYNNLIIINIIYNELIKIKEDLDIFS